MLEYLNMKRIFKKGENRNSLNLNNKCKNNLFDEEYVSNAWIYRFVSNGYDPSEDDHYVTKGSDGGYNMAGYFPEATRNYLIGLTLGF